MRGRSKFVAKRLGLSIAMDQAKNSVLSESAILPSYRLNARLATCSVAETQYACFATFQIALGLE